MILGKGISPWMGYSKEEGGGRGRGRIGGGDSVE